MTNTTKTRYTHYNIQTGADHGSEDDHPWMALAKTYEPLKVGATCVFAAKVAAENVTAFEAALDVDDDVSEYTDLVTVETMPEHLVESHRAAGNWGSYPSNGAERSQVTREEAEEIVASDPDGYARIVE